MLGRHNNIVQVGMIVGRGIPVPVGAPARMGKKSPSTNGDGDGNEIQSPSGDGERDVAKFYHVSILADRLGKNSHLHSRFCVPDWGKPHTGPLYN